MIQLIKSAFYLDTSMNVNIFLYYFKRIPILGKIFSDKIYQELSVKKMISYLVFMFNLFAGFFSSALYIGLALYLPVLFFYKNDNPGISFAAFVHLFFVLSLIVEGFIFSELFEASRKKIMAVRLLHFPLKNYMMSQLFNKIAWNLICSTPALIIFTILLKGSVIQALLLAFLAAFFKAIGEASNVLLFSKTNHSIRNNTLVFVILIIVFLIAAYVPVALHLTIPTKIILLSVPCIIIIVILGIISIRYIMNFSNYSSIFIEINKAKKLTTDTKKTAREASFSDVKLKDDDYSISLQHQDKFSKKSGYVYLNALFFERHRRIILKPMYISLIIITLLFITAVIANHFIPEFSVTYIDGILKGFPVFIFIMYTLSVQLCQRTTKAMFYNCDISLLRYSYYREKNVILSNFRIRLRKVILINGLPSVLIGISILLLGFLTEPARIMDIVPIVILIPILSVFFSVHHLFMYYVFQPYTTELDVKNPMYKLINGIMYFASYICLQIHEAPGFFVVVVFFITIIYTIAALLLVLKLAPNNFKVK